MESRAIAEKPERKPKADAEAIGEVTADLRQAADKIFGKVSPGAKSFDLSPDSRKKTGDTPRAPSRGAADL